MTRFEAALVFVTKCKRWEWFEYPPERLFLPVRNLLKQNRYAFYR